MTSKIKSDKTLDYRTTHSIFDSSTLINSQIELPESVNADLAKLDTLIAMGLNSETVQLSESVFHEYLFILDTFIKSVDKQVNGSLDYLLNLSKQTKPSDNKNVQEEMVCC